MMSVSKKIERHSQNDTNNEIEIPSDIYIYISRKKTTHF